ncbi:aminoglycoside phosphotransferase family protein [Nodosilinea sp. E11]|uniref:phosphotransferase family protein n=1 Tax=Nodosilinea sp. E11 TaxID=3037479 RepID=UPI002934FCC6|nr:aminoglycoside phosphotransferase family protein [Nodosilinea sp. E11]WOD37002.1 aminoglycoside phosphotransferase family protein [Nodosilinea sp. E11]
MPDSSLDPKIPFLQDALDSHQAQGQLQSTLPNLRAVTASTLVRHKPGRRALIEYQIDTLDGPLTLLGKIRAKGTDWKSYEVQQALWNQGFAADSPDGFSVPEPLGVVLDWQMWLQRKVPGIPATDILPTPAGIPLARSMATLARKLHHTAIPTTQAHTLADELRILHDRLPLVADQHPQWRSRIEIILQHCDTFATTLYPTSQPPTLIHRDFYPDQILVDHHRLWLVDLDLCCQGDPALDIGNFMAHITEQSLRQMGDSAAMDAQVATLRDTFIQAWISSSAADPTADPNQLPMAIELYNVLSLVRHIHISTRIPSRRHLTEEILILCEIRLQKLVLA